MFSSGPKQTCGMVYSHWEEIQLYSGLKTAFIKALERFSHGSRIGTDLFNCGCLIYNLEFTRDLGLFTAVIVHPKRRIWTNRKIHVRTRQHV